MRSSAGSTPTSSLRRAASPSARTISFARIEADLGVREVFWGVAVKPGKPLAFGVRDGTLVFGLAREPRLGARRLRALRPSRPSTPSRARRSLDRGSRAGHSRTAVRRNRERDEFVRGNRRNRDGVAGARPAERTGIAHDRARRLGRRAPAHSTWKRGRRRRFDCQVPRAELSGGSVLAARGAPRRQLVLWIVAPPIVGQPPHPRPERAAAGALGRGRVRRVAVHLERDQLSGHGQPGEEDRDGRKRRRTRSRSAPAGTTGRRGPARSARPSRRPAGTVPANPARSNASADPSGPVAHLGKPEPRVQRRKDEDQGVRVRGSRQQRRGRRARAAHPRTRPAAPRLAPAAGAADVPG